MRMFIDFELGSIMACMQNATGVEWDASKFMANVGYDFKANEEAFSISVSCEPYYDLDNKCCV